MLFALDKNIRNHKMYSGLDVFDEVGDNSYG